MTIYGITFHTVIFVSYYDLPFILAVAQLPGDKGPRDNK